MSGPKWAAVGSLLTVVAFLAVLAWWHFSTDEKPVTTKNGSLTAVERAEHDALTEAEAVVDGIGRLPVRDRDDAAWEWLRKGSSCDDGS